jgi:hypothetical protein
MFLGATWLMNISYVPWPPTYVPRFFAEEHLSISCSESGSEWKLGHHLRVRASQVKRLSIGLDRG